MAFAAIEPARIAAFIERAIGARVAWLLEEASQRGVTPRAVAEPLALRRFEATRRAVERRTPASRLFDLALACHRRGWLPPRAVATLSIGYFERLLPLVPDERGR